MAQCMICKERTFTGFGSRKMVETPQGAVHASCQADLWDALWNGKHEDETVAHLRHSVAAAQQYLHGR